MNIHPDSATVLVDALQLAIHLLVYSLCLALASPDFRLLHVLSMASVRYSTLLLLVAAFVMLLPGSMATDYVVGGPIGWKIPPRPTFYNDWAESNDAFHTGDTLDFQYNSGDSVLRVSLDDHNTCNTMHPLEVWFQGPHPYSLNGFSIIYFISGAPGHCAAGQKMLVKTLNV